MLFLQEWSPSALQNALRLSHFSAVRSLPSSMFLETGQSESDRMEGLTVALRRWAKQAAEPTARLIATLTGGYLLLGPNSLTFGQKLSRFAAATALSDQAVDSPRAMRHNGS
jgi:hypothetical protein